MSANPQTIKFLVSIIHTWYLMEGVAPNIQICIRRVSRATSMRRGPRADCLRKQCDNELNRRSHDDGYGSGWHRRQQPRRWHRRRCLRAASGWTNTGTARSAASRDVSPATSRAIVNHYIKSRTTSQQWLLLHIKQCWSKHLALTITARSLLRISALLIFPYSNLPRLLLHKIQIQALSDRQASIQFTICFWGLNVINIMM